MDTIEKIKQEAEEIVMKLKNGGIATVSDIKVLKIWEGLTGGVAGNAGIRKHPKGTLPPMKPNR